MRVSDIAKRLHISPSWLRRLERSGRIPEPSRDLNGHRRYTEADLTKIKIAVFRPARSKTQAAMGRRD
jgi:DNA-binding transcriptional MerR regulator